LLYFHQFLDHLFYLSYFLYFYINQNHLILYDLSYLLEYYLVLNLYAHNLTNALTQQLKSWNLFIIIHIQPSKILLLLLSKYLFSLIMSSNHPHLNTPLLNINDFHLEMNILNLLSIHNLLLLICLFQLGHGLPININLYFKYFYIFFHIFLYFYLFLF